MRDRLPFYLSWVKSLSRTTGDVLLGVFAVAVVIGSVATVRQGGETATVAALVVPTASAPASPAAVVASSGPSSAASAVLLAGSDLELLRDGLARATGYQLLSVPSTDAAVVTAAALDALTVTPSAVVLEVKAGSKTTVRTADAISAVLTRWPSTHVLVVGPFSSADRKSATAAKTAALAAGVTFLDPVLLHWRSPDVTPGLLIGDFPAVTEQLAAALA